MLVFLPMMALPTGGFEPRLPRFGNFNLMHTAFDFDPPGAFWLVCRVVDDEVSLRKKPRSDLVLFTGSMG